jgi:hypothetical protein
MKNDKALILRYFAKCPHVDAPDAPPDFGAICAAPLAMQGGAV